MLSDVFEIYLVTARKAICKDATTKWVKENKRSVEKKGIFSPITIVVSAWFTDVTPQTRFIHKQQLIGFKFVASDFLE